MQVPELAHGAPLGIGRAARIESALGADPGFSTEERARSTGGEMLSWEGQRRYATVEAHRRLHQAQFRHYVVRAYAARCAICRIPSVDLLDASHILPDRDPGARVEVPNGLALCQLHHRAFDRDLLGVRPDGVVELARALLDTDDGPTFEQAFRRVHGQQIGQPRREVDRPRPTYLEERFERFRATAR